jgi:hypothetical protein
VVALVAAFLAGCVLGLTGFGSAPISLPLLLLVYGPTTVVALAPVLSNVHQRGGGVIVVESIDRAIVFALLFTALGEVMVGVEVLRVAGPEYVRLGWLLRCRLGAAPSAGRRAARGGIALGAGGGGLGERSALDLDGTTRRSTDSLTSCLLRLP